MTGRTPPLLREHGKCRYTFNQKRDYIRQIENCTENGDTLLAIQQVSNNAKVHFSTLRGFWDRREEIEHRCQNGDGELKAKRNSKRPAEKSEVKKVKRYTYDSLHNYPESDIYLAAEMGLFYRMNKHEFHHLTGERCANGDKSDERLTVLAIANLEGTKRNLTVIGATGRQTNVPGINYKFNSKAWMTRDIFESEVLEWDKELQTTGRKVLLFAKKTSVHAQVPNLKNIQLQYYPEGNTDPLYMLKCMKAYYRRSLIEKTKAHPKIDHDDALLELHLAWKNVSFEEVESSFAEVGILNGGKPSLSPIETWLELHAIQKSYTNFDDNLVTYAESHCGVAAAGEANGYYDEVTVEDAFVAVQKVRNYCKHARKELLQQILDIQQEIENDYWKFRTAKDQGESGLQSAQANPKQDPKDKQEVSKISNQTSSVQHALQEVASTSTHQPSTAKKDVRHQAKPTGAICRPPLKRSAPNVESGIPAKQKRENQAANNPQKKVPSLNPTERLAIVKRSVELKLCAYVAEHNCLACANHLGEFIAALVPSSKILSQVHLNQTKFTKLVADVIGPSLLQMLLRDVGDSHYSLIIDDGTDVTTSKTLCLILKYYSRVKKDIVTTFYRVISIDDSTGQGLFNAIIQQLAEDKLDTKKLLGIATNGTSLFDAQQSLTTLFKSPCICSFLEICAEKACKELSRTLEILLKGCHNYFSRRPEKLAEYRDFCGGSVRGIPPVEGTPWLARKAAIEVVLDQWNKLAAFFEKDKSEDAQKLTTIFKIHAYKAYLVFLKSTLFQGPISSTYKLFQNQNNSFDVYKKTLSLYRTLLRKMIAPSQLEIITDDKLVGYHFQSSIMPLDSITLGEEFESIINQLRPNDKEDVKKKCVQFITTFCSQIQERLQWKMMKNMSNFQPQICTSQKKPKLVEMFHQFGSFNLPACQEEWDNLGSQEWGDATQNEKAFWVTVSEEVDKFDNKKYPNISDLGLSLMCLPISYNDTVNRCFSVYRSVKTALVDKPSQNFFQSFLLFKYYLKKNHKSCFQFKAPETMRLLLQKYEKEENTISPLDVQILNEILAKSVDC